MKKVVLIFPSTERLTDFVVEVQTKKAEVNSIEQTVTATITDWQLEMAQTVYGAVVRNLVPEN
jgi:hypothetical protein